MDFNNVNLWFAKDKNDEIITIDKINDDNKHDIYTCPICGSDVIARKGDIKIHHFAHRDKSKCSSETMIHWWVKHKLIEVGDKFSIKINKDDIKEFTCKDILIEKEYETEFGVYKPDITIITETGEIIYFEIDYTNKKKIEEYLDRWLFLNNIVVEVSVKDMINNNVKELKTIFYNGIVYQNINSNVVNVLRSRINKSENEFNYKYLHKILWLFNEIRENNFDIQEEKECVFEILDSTIDNYIIDKKTLDYILKSKCINIKSEFIKHRINTALNICNKYVDEINSISEIKFYKVEESTYYKTPVIYIEDYYEDNIATIYYYSNINEIKTNLSLIRDNKLILRKHSDILNKIINEFNFYLKDINNGYYSLYCDDGYFKVYFDGYRIIDIYKSIDYNGNIEELVECLKEEFNKYRNTLDIINKSTINRINDIYDFVKARTETINPYEYIYFTRVSSWHPRKHKGTHYYKAKKYIKGEDEITLNIEMCKNKIGIIFKNNEIKFDKQTITSNFENEDLETIKIKIMKSISEKIREERYGSSTK